MEEEYSKRENEMISSGGQVEIIFSNEQMRTSRQGGGMKIFFVKRADEIFSSGVGGRRIF